MKILKFTDFINESKIIKNKSYDTDFIINNFSKSLSWGEMVNFIDDNKLRDSNGMLDYNDAKEIAYATRDNWKLTLVNTKDVCDWVFEKPYKTKINIPPIVIKTDDGYEVLDGKTRLGYLNSIDVEQVYVYLGNSD